IKGLKGEADKDRNGVVTSGELQIYLQARVREYTSKKFPVGQTPLPSQKFNPKFPMAVLNIGNWLDRGLMAYENKIYEEAIGYFTKAIGLSPQYQNAYLLRGNVKYDLGDKQGAIADFTKAIEIDPEYTAAYNSRGIGKSNLGDKQGAIADFTKAIEIDP